MEGNQVWEENPLSFVATIIPPTAKAQTMTMTKIRPQQVKFESYQGVMVFLKKGF